VLLNLVDRVDARSRSAIDRLFTGRLAIRTTRQIATNVEYYKIFKKSLVNVSIAITPIRLFDRGYVWLQAETILQNVIPVGGQVFKPKMSIGQYGFMALILDTESNMIGLHMPPTAAA
jgi:hypothetical protein